MIFVRKSSQRGVSKTHWLNSAHTFSFAEYYDPKFMGFGHLRIINEDIVQPGFGFSRHAHNNMEIISYVVSGALEHKDSMDNGSIIRSGEIQIMTAGTGIEHSEFNHSKTDALHFLQLWILPEKMNLKPSYQQQAFQRVSNQLILIGAPGKQENAITIHQDVKLYVAFLTQNHLISYPLQKDRMGWLQLIKGNISLNEQVLSAGDGAIIQNQAILIHANENSEFLLFDLVSS